KLHGPVWPPQRRSDSTAPVWFKDTSRSRSSRNGWSRKRPPPPMVPCARAAEADLRSITPALSTTCGGGWPPANPETDERSNLHPQTKDS
ncbi:hypothetical protein C8247_07795, partial [Paracidovorax avenae]